MGSFNDIAGERFGLLTVIERVGNKNHQTQWLCQCECGNKTVVGRNNLLKGRTQSCGCLKHRPAKNKTHGQSKTRLYYVWRNMLNRCYNEKVSDYHNYGGRNIVVCDEWKNDFQAFSSWAFENGYDATAKRGVSTLDRIDSNGNYEPSNCRWVNGSVQANNKRSNHAIEYKGIVMSMRQVSDASGIPYSALRKRILSLHWDVEKATTKEVRTFSKRKAGG